MAASPGSVWPWTVWLGGAIGVAALAFLAGTAGIFGRPDALPAELGLVGAIAGATPALDCPRGEPVATLTPGERVLVTARTPDGAYLAVRVPGKTYETVWVEALALQPDDPGALVGLPLDECISAVR